MSSISSFEVAQFLADTDNGTFIKEIYLFSNALNIPPSIYERYRPRLIFDCITYVEFFHHILNYWISQSSPGEKTISKLSSVLESIQHKSESEKLLERYEGTALIVIQKDNIPGSHAHNISFQNVPPPTPKFSGRTYQLEELTKYFHSKHQRTVLINGMGGVGKTELVREFARKLKEDQVANCVCFHGANLASLKDSVIELAEELKLNTKHKDTEKEEDAIKIVQNVITKLTNSTRQETWLIIIDNLDKKEVLENLGGPLIKLFHNQPMFMTIVTSRLPGALDGEGVNLELLSWTDPEALEFVTENLESPGENEDIQQLCNTFGNLPFALNLGVGVIVQKRRLSIKGKSYGIKDFLEELNLDKERARKENHLWNQLGSLWRISIQSLQCEEPFGLSATELICCLGFLNPDAIKVDTLNNILHFSATITHPGSSSFLTRLFSTLSIFKIPFSGDKRCSLWEKAIDKNIVVESLELLKAYSLIRVEEYIVSIHRLLQEVICQEFVDEFSAKHPLQTLASGASALLKESKVFEKDPLRQTLTLWNHLKEADNLVIQFKAVPSHIARWMWQLGLHTEVLTFLQTNETRITSLLPPNDKEFIMFKKALANAYQINGNWENAKSLLVSLIPLMDSVLGIEDEETILTKLNFGAVLRHDGDLDKALDLYIKQLTIAQSLAKQIGKNETTLTIKIKQKLAHMYGRTGDLDKERETLEEILKWREENQLKDQENREEGKITRETTSTLRTRHNLGCCLIRLKKYREAKATLQFVYDQRKKLLTEEHPSTLNTKQDLAEAMLQDGESEEEKATAISYLKEILPMKIKVHGENHRRTQQAREAIERFVSS